MISSRISFNTKEKAKIKKNINKFIENDLSKIIYDGVDLNENEVFLNIYLDEKTLKVKHYISYNNNSIDLGIAYLVEGFNINCIEEFIINEEYEPDENGGKTKTKIDFDEIDDFLNIIQVNFLVKELENIDLDDLGYIL